MTTARAGHAGGDFEVPAVANRERFPAPHSDLTPATNLAALLDQFTRSVTAPEAHTVGEFAATVGALHGELAMLARQFSAGPQVGSELDFDDIFPEGAEACDSIEPGLAASEELEHLCWQLSR